MLLWQSWLKKDSGIFCSTWMAYSPSFANTQLHNGNHILKIQTQIASILLCNIMIPYFLRGTSCLGNVTFYVSIICRRQPISHTPRETHFSYKVPLECDPSLHVGSGTLRPVMTSLEALLLMQCSLTHGLPADT